MKPFNFSSPYSHLGILSAIFACAAVLTFQVTKPAEPDFVFATDAFGSGEPFDLSHMDLSEFNFEKTVPHHDDIPNFRDHSRFLYNEGSAKAPCFTVQIDPTVDGADSDYRTDLFGDGQLLISSDKFAESLKQRMADDFSAETWARDDNCFDGSFVVSFAVTAEGRLGDDMLVHHLRGKSNSAGISVLDVLRSLDREGVRWHDGTKGAGEVRIPVKFKLG